MVTRKCRIALYSHDTAGLGHCRRNLLIARALADSAPPATILMIAGAPEAGVFPLPPGVDCLTLPAFFKEAQGHYRPRCLDLNLDELVALRAKIISAALDSFRPDVLIVDNKPRGALGELDPALESLRSGGRTRCVLGLRDVLDEAAVLCAEWKRADNDYALRHYYDAIWVYGDPKVYDPVTEYRFKAEAAAKVRYTGYFNRSLPAPFAAGAEPEWSAPLKTPGERLVLCLLGGGQDGACLAEAFAQADFPAGAGGVILTGPFLPPEALTRLRRRAAQRRDLRVVGFVTDPHLLLHCADQVIAMGGYNTICEVLSFQKRALVVPRVAPRREQLVRAERLRDLGLVDMLHPAELNPRALTEWLARDPRARPLVPSPIDMNGLARLPQFLQDVLALPIAPPERPFHGEVFEHVAP